MGCGHSKINIYRKYKNKANSKNVVANHEVVPKEEGGVEIVVDSPEKLEDSDPKRTVKVKPFGGSLLAQTEISTSQQDFFKMLDEKIQNGPDYNSDSESERTAEAVRLKALLKDWDTASCGSRSLPVTPKRRLNTVKSTTETMTEVDASRIPPVNEMNFKPQVSPSIVHQSYGIPQVAYLQTHYNNSNYLAKSPSYQLSYPSALQYQAISPMYSSNDSNYQPQPFQLRQYPSYNQYGSPIKTYVSSPTKHIPYEPSSVMYSPTHRLYGPLITVPCNKETADTEVDYNNTYYVNSDVLEQHQQPQQVFNHHPNQYQQFKEAREQVLTQHQQQQNSYRGPQKSFQPNVSTPLLIKERHEINSLHKKQYELT